MFYVWAGKTRRYLTEPPVRAIADCIAVFALCSLFPQYRRGYWQVPRVLKQSTAPVKVVPRDASVKRALGKEFGLEVPMGTAETALNVRTSSD